MIVVDVMIDDAVTAVLTRTRVARLRLLLLTVLAAVKQEGGRKALLIEIVCMTRIVSKNERLFLS